MLGFRGALLRCGLGCALWLECTLLLGRHVALLGLHGALLGFNSTLWLGSALHRLRRSAGTVFRSGRTLLGLDVVLLDSYAALLLLPDCGGGFGDVRGAGGNACRTGEGGLSRTAMVGGV